MPELGLYLDECHRAVTPGTKRELERFFVKSLWYGFTGTPRFAENPYPQMGDLPRTTEDLYGQRLHKYTIQNAIHDNAVLGFLVEHNGPKNISDETDASAYENEEHMLSVLDVILNKSYNKLGFQNGKGQTYEGILTTSSIQIAQKYYELLKRVKAGETSLKIDEKIKRVLPDFPKFAITYSVTENEEGSRVNQQKMKESLDDYNGIFDKNKAYGQIVTFQAPKLFKESVDNAVKLYSAGSTEVALLAEWEEIEPDLPIVDLDYELMAYSHTKIDYEYIINLIQNIVTPTDDVEVTLEQRQKQLKEVRQYIEDLRKDNPKIAEIMTNLVSDIEQDKDKYKGKSILNIVENMKHDCIEKVVTDFCVEWYVSKDDVMYAATHYRKGEIPNENAIKITADFTSYKEAQERAIPKFKYYAKMLAELKKTLDDEIAPLTSR